MYTNFDKLVYVEYNTLYIALSSSKLHTFRTNLPAAISQLYQYRSTLHDLRQQVQNHQMFFKEQHGELTGAITTISAKYAAGEYLLSKP